MRPSVHVALALATVTAVTGTALADEGPPPGGVPLGPAAAGMPAGMPTGAPPQADAPPPEEGEAKDDKPERGDFDAGGQVRLPNGPDEMGEYATFNWIALDAIGTYHLLDSVKVVGRAPLAVKKPEMLPTGEDPRLFGGFSVTLDARLPTGAFAPKRYQTEAALVLSGAYMREGAMLLSDKDFPRFVGGFQPGLTAGLDARVKLSSVVDFQMRPVFVYQAGDAEALTAVQLPMSTVIGLGELLKVSADLGIFTGDDYSFSGDHGGRIAAGGALDGKIGPIVAHAGAGVASLLTGGAYPTISDSFYVDLNVKYAK